MTPLSRRDAKALELKRYWTGQPCSNGHVGERLTSTSQCIQCRRVWERGAIRDWKRRNRDSYNAKEKVAAVNRRRARRIAAVEKLGGCCIRCGYADERALQFDHVIPLRRKENGMTRGGTLIPAEFKAVMSGEAHNIQLLCANCHAIKTAEEDTDNYTLGEGL